MAGVLIERKFGHRGKEATCRHRRKVVVCKSRRRALQEKQLCPHLHLRLQPPEQWGDGACSWKPPVCGALSRQLKLTHADTSALTCRLIKYCFLLPIFFSRGPALRNSTGKRNVPTASWTLLWLSPSHLGWPLSGLAPWLVSVAVRSQLHQAQHRHGQALCVSVAWLRPVPWHQEGSPLPGKLAVWDCFLIDASASG